MIFVSVTVMLLVGSAAAADTTNYDTSTTSVSSSLSSTSSITNTTSTTSDNTKTTTTSNKTITSNTTSNTISSTKNLSTTNVTSSDSKSLKSSSSSTNKLNTSMSVTNTTLKGYSTYTLKATVVDSTNNYVTNGTVVFKINGVTVGNTTVKSGKASYTYQLTGFSAKTYNITAIYGGTSKYNSANTTGTLIITKYSTKVTVSNITGISGSSSTIKAVITTSDGSQVKSGLVAFKINGKTIGYANTTSGVAKLSYTIPSSYANTQYTITAVYGGNVIYSSSQSNGTLTLTPSTSTKVTVNTITANVGSNIILKATIKTSSGSSVSSGLVAFKINGKTVGYGSVDNSVATLNYTIPSNYGDSKYIITAVYGGNGKYISSRANGTLNIYKKQSTTVSVTTITSSAGKTVTLTSTIKTSSGSYVKNGTVAFKINGKTIGYANTTSGVAKLSYTIPSSYGDSSYIITAVYGGNTYYGSSRANGTLKLTTNSVSTISIPSGYSKYVVSSSNCNISNSKIQAWAKTILTKLSTSSTLTVAKYVFSYVNNITSYSGYSNTRYGAVGTLTRGYGNCVDLSHLVIAVMRACNIPARYCHATCTFRSGLKTGHVWAEVYVNGKWYSCDASSSSNTFGNIVNWSSCGSITRYISLPF